MAQNPQCLRKINVFKKRGFVSMEQKMREKKQKVKVGEKKRTETVAQSKNTKSSGGKGGKKNCSGAV